MASVLLISKLLEYYRMMKATYILYHNQYFISLSTYWDKNLDAKLE